MTTLTFPVSGMTCAACSSRVQRALERESGVDQAAVNLPVAAAGVLSPMLASAAMAVSSVSVVSNSLRLRRARVG